ncbi:sodium-dependent transporter [uncultured Methanobrevibacter sp.]|uniref:sodium-dependent transporter n=1 Tax=uncultured Methanobrevibacter sp. TaxID=253161 RepID=UPI0025F80456|nr:sodium-dependent transporter [uncultured Methanobrevibacter sp.]
MNNTSQWNSTLTFILAMIGLTIGIGNIWRFSYVLYSNGGGSFFIPYTIAILVMGVPFLILEYGLGFSFKKSFSNLMHSIRPGFEIIAWMLVLLVFIVVIYYMVIIGWDLAYLLNSFTFGWGNDPASFFTSYVGGSSDLSSSTTIILPTLICTLILWAVFWAISIKDVDKGIGKLSTILIPLLFTIMIFIFIYAFTLPGFHIGVSTLLTPNWSMLLDIHVWLAAFGQTIFSLSIGQAMVYTYASYLPKNTKLVDEVLIVVIINSLYEIFIAFGVFSILGYMSLHSSIPMNELISEGTGLIFIVFPQIFNTMGGMGHVIAPLLFISILFAGFTSAFALFEPLLSSLCNKLGWSRKKGVTILTIVACIGTVIFSTGCSSYLVGVVDGFVNNFGILILIGVQAIIFGWLYGVEKVIPVLNEFSTFKVGKTWVFTLKYLLPILLIIVWIFGVVDLFHNESAFEIIIYAIITIIVVGLSVAFTKLSPKKS